MGGCISSKSKFPNKNDESKYLQKLENILFQDPGNRGTTFFSLIFNSKIHFHCKKKKHKIRKPYTEKSKIILHKKLQYHRLNSLFYGPFCHFVQGKKFF